MAALLAAALQHRYAARPDRLLGDAMALAHVCVVTSLAAGGMALLAAGIRDLIHKPSHAPGRADS